MSDLQQNIIFPGSGMDSDSAEEFFALGDGKERRNIYYPPDSNGVIKNMLGNSFIPHGFSHDISLKSFKTVCYVNDNENRKSYYFILGSIAEEMSSATTSTTSTSTITETTLTTLTTSSTSTSTTSTTTCTETFLSPDYLNSLIEYSHDDETFTKVLWDQGNLLLDPDIYIKDPVFVDGWIYYNGGIHGPQKVNIALAKSYTETDIWVTGANYVIDDTVRVDDGRVYIAIKDQTPSSTDPRDDAVNWEISGYCYPFDFETGEITDTALSAINLPPISRLTTSFGSDTDKFVNNIRKRLFQFTYRFKYRFHGYSVTAPISAITLPRDNESVSGEIVNKITTNNYLTLAFDSGFQGSIEWVELFVREGNDGFWKYLDRVDSGTGTYDFYNDRVLAEAAELEINKLADAVPRQINSQEFVTENTLLYGGVTEGFNNIALDVTLTADVEEVDLSSKGNTKGDFHLTTEESIGYQVYRKVAINADWGAIAPAATDIVVIYIEKENPSEILEVQFTYVGASETAFRNECIAAINNVGGDILAHYDTNPPNFVSIALVGGDFYVEAIDKGTTTFNSITSTIEVFPTHATDEPNKWGGFKTGAHHPFALTYYDGEFRPLAAMTGEGTEVYVPIMTEEGTITTYSYRTVIKWQINHSPPPEAKYYQWFYAGNTSIGMFWQYPIRDATDGADYLELDIDPLQTHQDEYPLSQLPPYTYEQKDRVRILTKKAVAGAYGILTTQVGGTPNAAQDISDLEIIDYEVSGTTPTFDSEIFIEKDTIGIHYGADDGSLIEIYRPRNIDDDDLLYYAYSRIYDIYECGGHNYHRGQSQDQCAYHPAEGIFTQGDVYFISRAFSEAFAGGNVGDIYLVESPSYSDFYDSDSYNTGKINVESDLGEVFLNNIRWSNKYLQNTAINGLSTFNGLDYKGLSDRDGAIKAMRQKGDTLKVYQTDAPVSVWIGKTEYYDAGGGINVVKSLNVLGSTRKDLRYDYGTSNPESVTQNEQYIYGFDILHGVFWRDAYNGLFPISGKATTPTGEQADYKMFQYFKDKSDALLTSGIDNVKVITEWDDYLECLFVTFRDTINPANNDTITFHEPSNRWISLYDFKGNYLERHEYNTIERGHLDSPLYTSHVEPQLYFYSGIYDKTYGVWMQRGGLDTPVAGAGSVESMVYAINHADNSISSSYGVGVGFNWPIGGGTDKHATPCVIVADDGHIVVAHNQLIGVHPSAHHNSKVEIKRSDNPEDETSWSGANAHSAGYYTTVGGNTTETLAYPKLYKMANGDIVLFARLRPNPGNLRQLALYKSTNNGVTWSTVNVIVDLGNNNYWCYNTQPHRGIDNNIYIEINILDWAAGPKWISSHLIKSVDGGTKWTDIAGNGEIDISVSPISRTDLSGHDYTIISNITNGVVIDSSCIDSEGNPYFLVYDDYTTVLVTDVVDLKLCEYHDGAWHHHSTGLAITDRSHSVLKALGGGVVDIYSREAAGDDSEYRRYRCYDTTTPGALNLTLLEVIVSETKTRNTTLFYPKHTFNNLDTDHYAIVNMTTADPTYSDLFFAIKLVGTTEYYMRYKKDFFSFLNGQLYKHNDVTVDRSTFYDTKYDVIMDVVANNNPNITKVFDSLSIHTDGDWEVTDIEIAADNNYPRGMYSKIPSHIFEEREGKQLAEFLKNMKTTSDTATGIDLYEGEELRGRAMYIKMKNTQIDEVRLLEVDVNSSSSKV